MAYQEFEADDELELEFWLAGHLGMTVGRLRDEMSSDELMRWGVWLGREGQKGELRG